MTVENEDPNALFLSSIMLFGIALKIGNDDRVAELQICRRDKKEWSERDGD